MPLQRSTPWNFLMVNAMKNLEVGRRHQVMFVSAWEVYECRKTSDTSPRLLLKQVTWTPRLVLETRLLMEIRLLFKHCQLAILNFFVYIRNTWFQIRNTTNKHVYVSFCRNSMPIGPISATTGTRWTPGLLETRLVIETRLLLEQVTWTSSLYWRPGLL